MFIRIIFSLVIVLGLTGNVAAAEKFIIGFAQDNMSNDWRAAQVKEVETALKAYPNVEFIFTDAGGSVPQNIEDIEDLVDRKINLLMVSPRDPRIMTPVISSFYKKGIPVILLTRRILSNDYTTFIGANDSIIAAGAADQIAKALNGKGKVFVLQGVPTATTAINRTKGFVERMKVHPGIEIVAIETAKYQRGEAVKVIQDSLEKGTKFDAIYAQSDSMAAGARLALKAFGLDPKSIPIVGIDYISEAREAIRDGNQYASFLYPTAGKKAAEIAIRILKGESVDREIGIPSQMVTRKNVDQVKPIF